MRHLVLRSLVYYWRTNLAVVAGVATAVAVLSGALLVGDSVRESLRALALERLGRTEAAVLSAGFFREQLADDVRADGTLHAVPIVVLPGVVAEQGSRRRVGQVRVYGVDERFWQFHGQTTEGPGAGEALVSPALARELGFSDEEGGGPPVVLVRVQRPSDIPLESLHSRKEDLGRTLRRTVRGVVPRSALGEFSLDAQQGEVRAVFVSLPQIQRELGIAGRVNAILVSSSSGGQPDPGATLEQRIRTAATLEDIGLTLRPLENRGMVTLGADAGLLTDQQAGVAGRALEEEGSSTQRVFTYLANSLRIGAREVPYSLVSALDLAGIAPDLGPTPGPEAPIVLNQWAASDLRATVGDRVAMEYFRWEEPGRLVTDTTMFRVAAIVPVTAGDRDLAPTYPGITDSAALVDWDPPFPIDLRRIRPADEAYWEQYRTTPKAFVPLEVGQRLWRSRYGALTSIRIAPRPGESLSEAQGRSEQRLRDAIDPLAMGLAVRNVRAENLAASRGSTDFATYFVSFSVFIVLSALVLTSLFFKLGLEQRVREVGLLRAVGFGPPAVRRLFMAEGVLLAVAGSIAGGAAAVGYAALLMAGLRSWWVDAVGTSALALHVSVATLAAGAVSGVAAAVVCIWWTLRGLGRLSERALLAGELVKSQIPNPKSQRAESSGSVEQRRRRLTAMFLAGAGLTLLAASRAGLMEPAGAFFAAGALLLAAMLTLFAALLRRRAGEPMHGRGWQPLSKLGLRNTTYRPSRSVLSVAVIASATFILISVDAFRRDTSVNPADLHSGVGGYSLLVETLVPVVHDPQSDAGREALNLRLESVRIEPFRLRPGDDASCLNLYAPANPRILAPSERFLDEGRFAFQGSLAATDAERANPWLLLRREEPDGVIPVIADANSMTYVLHRRLGDDIVIVQGGREIRLRLVAALRDSLFQSELLMSPRRFTEAFPEQAGYQVMLLETAPDRTVEVAAQIEDALADFGADAVATGDRLAAFHRVENTYLSTFQTLGGLGLLLGTVGLATVMLRNALERRRELALLGAGGYPGRHFMIMVAAPNVCTPCASRVCYRRSWQRGWWYEVRSSNRSEVSRSGFIADVVPGFSRAEARHYVRNWAPVAGYETGSRHFRYLRHI